MNALCVIDVWHIGVAHRYNTKQSNALAAKYTFMMLVVFSSPFEQLIEFFSSACFPEIKQYQQYLHIIITIECLCTDNGKWSELI